MRPHEPGQGGVAGRRECRMSLRQSWAKGLVGAARGVEADAEGHWENVGVFCARVLQFDLV